jgi:hypothetical protein
MLSRCMCIECLSMLPGKAGLKKLQSAMYRQSSLLYIQQPRLAGLTRQKDTLGHISDDVMQQVRCYVGRSQPDGQIGCPGRQHKGPARDGYHLPYTLPDYRRL